MSDVTAAGSMRGGRQPGTTGYVRFAAKSAAAVAILVLAAILLLRGGFYGTMVEDMLIFGIAAMGVDFLGGYGGLVSLGQAGFVGLGAYGVAYGESHQWGPWSAIGLAVGVILLVGLIGGVLAVRVSGIGFVIITLAFSQILWGLAYRWVAVSGGDNGLPIPVEPKLGPLDFSNGRVLAMGILAVFVISAALLRLFVSSPFGLSLQGIKANERRLKTLGYSTGLHRYIGYVISAFFGGVAGILYGFSNNLISPTSMDFAHNGIITVMAVLGGLGTLWGPVLGSVVITLLQQDLSLYFQRWESVMGALFVVIVLFAPSGLWGELTKIPDRVAHIVGRARPAVPQARAPAESPVRDGDRVANVAAPNAQQQQREEL